jgi:hypothetical protein
MASERAHLRAKVREQKLHSCGVLFVSGRGQPTGTAPGAVVLNGRLSSCRCTCVRFLKTLRQIEHRWRAGVVFVVGLSGISAVESRMRMWVIPESGSFPSYKTALLTKEERTRDCRP